MICDKLAPPLITVQHLSSPLLSCRHSHTYTYVRTPLLRARYDYPGVVYPMTLVLNFLDFLIFPLIAPLSLSLSVCVCVCVCVCVYVCVYVWCVIFTNHLLSLISSVLSLLQKIYLVFKDFRCLTSWKLIGYGVFNYGNSESCFRFYATLMLKIRIFSLRKMKNTRGYILHIFHTMKYIWRA